MSLCPFFSANESENDPVCKLSNAEKLRLCTIVMNTRQYVRKIKFVPIMDNVMPKCERKVVSISIEEVLKNVSSRRHCI